MEEDEINQRTANEYNNEFSESQDYYNNREKSQFITFKKDENYSSNDKNNASNEISPIKFSETVNTRPFHSIDNYHQNRFTDYNPHNPFTYNRINKIKYSNNSLPINIIQNDNDNESNNNYYCGRKTYVNRSQDFSPNFFNNKAKYKKFNKSQLYKENTTDEGESYINQNRDSTYYNNNNNSNNQTQNMYMTSKAEYPLEQQQLNTKDYSEDEQLIIYPEKKYIFVDEKYFSKKNNEGILKPKNLETYEIRSIEYIPDEEHQYKSISLGDYILRGNKNRMRKNKSCNNIMKNKKIEGGEIEYEIKLLQNKSKKKEKIEKKETVLKKNLITNDVLYNIKTLKDKHETKTNVKKINKINDDSSRVNTGGIIDLSDKKKYENKFIKIKYPKWKILASACLIQSWFRSLKRLKLLYKKNLHKIIIIQKVYKLHYKYKLLSNRQKPNIYKSYTKETKEDYNNIYRTKKPKKYLGKYTKQTLPKYKKTIPIIYNSSSEDYNSCNYKYNYTYYRTNKDKIYNKPYISNIHYTNNNSSYSAYKEQIQQTPKNEIKYINYNMMNIAVLLMEKILENKILKIYFNFIDKLKNSPYKKIKKDNTALNNNVNINNIKLSLERKNQNNSVQNNYRNKIILQKNALKKITNNDVNIILKNKNNSSPTLKQKNLLKKIFLKFWYRKSFGLNNEKEIKKLNLVNLYNLINNRNKQNLKFAFKKIKKFAKVKFNVLNNYASIIQNAFRYYIENKQKEKK